MEFERFLTSILNLFSLGNYFEKEWCSTISQRGCVRIKIWASWMRGCGWKRPRGRCRRSLQALLHHSREGHCFMPFSLPLRGLSHIGGVSMVLIPMATSPSRPRALICLEKISFKGEIETLVRMMYPMWERSQEGRSIHDISIDEFGGQMLSVSSRFPIPKRKPCFLLRGGRQPINQIDEFRKVLFEETSLDFGTFLRIVFELDFPLPPILYFHRSLSRGALLCDFWLFWNSHFGEVPSSACEPRPLLDIASTSSSMVFVNWLVSSFDVPLLILCPLNWKGTLNDHSSIQFIIPQHEHGKMRAPPVLSEKMAGPGGV